MLKPQNNDFITSSQLIDYIFQTFEVCIIKNKLILNRNVCNLYINIKYY